ncbi:ribonuclease z, putative [Heliomicrobium modesticaldum Ice1]|uniref:Ribonuclease z, putative n=1 Tax=Heliobacterium modesticaldum (strain ATCC 51547 / Ice1) TaxID=498761 RepID=B0TEY8_HELMI|nr:ribonuclease Z [Heliomicrobium modesticaldum]ABZ82971.1 ribonuclease z, putative [Heliomicrobium modesticaldum Ice1]
MFRITFFGTGNGLSYPNRENTFFLVQVGKAYLVDCGGAPWPKLVKAGLRPDDLGAILITHGHPDHTYGLPALIQSLWLAGRKKLLPIYFPAGARGIVQGLLDLFELTTKPNMFPIAFREQPLEERETEALQDGSLTVSTFPAIHGIPTMGVSFLDESKEGLEKSPIKVVYSADTAYNPLLETVALEATCLIHECNGADKAAGKHSSLHDVARLMKKTNPKQVAIVHLTEGEGYERLMAQYGLAQPRFMIAEDGMSIRVAQ